MCVCVYVCACVCPWSMCASTHVLYPILPVLWCMFPSSAFSLALSLNGAITNVLKVAVGR